MKSDIRLKTSFRDKPIKSPRKLPIETTKASVLKTKIKQDTGKYSLISFSKRDVLDCL